MKRGRKPYSNVTIRNEQNTLRDTFSTNAPKEILIAIIGANKNKPQHIRKHDIHNMKSSIHWVPYHLIRAGYKVSEKKPNRPTFPFITDTMSAIEKWHNY